MNSATPFTSTYSLTHTIAEKSPSSSPPPHHISHRNLIIASFATEALTSSRATK
ncbi:unnamed protein product [Caenorhabditis brenneri]